MKVEVKNSKKAEVFEAELKNPVKNLNGIEKPREESKKPTVDRLSMEDGSRSGKPNNWEG